jgi:exodeoxyribonuclease V alpha subunit
MSERITGELVSHRVVGDDFWSIATIKTNNGAVAVVGKLLGVELGDTIEVEGFFDDHKTFGRQFKVRDCICLLPRSDAGVVSWIAGRLKHIGPERAKKMLAHFGSPDALWNVIEKEPHRLLEINGITDKRVEEITTAYHRFRADRDRMIRFKRWGMTDNQIAKVIAKWGNDAEEKMKKNPYALADFVDGFGFILADKIAQRMGVPLDSIPRIQCGLRHTMQQAAGHGHMYISSGKLVALAADKVLRVDGKLVAAELAKMKKAGDRVQHGNRTFMRHLNEFEQVCADTIRALLDQRKGR